MAVTQVNGDIPSSAHPSAFIQVRICNNCDRIHLFVPSILTRSLQHLLDYPLISDGISTFKSNEYGQRSIKLGDSAYQTLAAPVIPYFAKPYQFVSPYVQRVDSLGDKTLGAIDERFPIVKKPTSDLYNDTKGLVLLPYNKGLEGKEHVFQLYSTEFKKNDQQGLVAHGKAAVTTALVVSNETLSWISNFLAAKKNEASKTANDAAKAASDKINQ